MRKSIALALIKLAHRINPPSVTEFTINATDPVAAKNALTDWETQQRAVHQATRWN